MKNEITKFEVGKVYPLHDICYTVIERTDKYITVKYQTAMSNVLGYYNEKVSRQMIKFDDKGNEVVYGLSAFGRLESTVDIETYEKRFNCKLVGGEFVSYNWNEENTVEVEVEENAASVEVQENATSELESKLAAVKEIPKVADVTGTAEFWAAHNVIKYLNEKLTKAKKKIVLVDQDDEENRYKMRGNYELIFNGVNGRAMFSIELYHGKSAFNTNLGYTSLADYNTVEGFKAAARELAAAIERGDKEFTFPAEVEENAASVEVPVVKSNLYHVVTEKEIARNEAYEDAGEYDKVKNWEGKLRIYPVGLYAEVDMTIEAKTTKTALRRFIKAYNQASKNGAIPALIVEKIGDEIPANDVENWEEMNEKSIEEEDVHEFSATAQDLENYRYDVYWYHERNEDYHYIFIKIDTKFEEHRAEWLKAQEQEVVEVEEKVIATAGIENAASVEVQMDATSELEGELAAVKAQIENSTAKISDKASNIKYYQKCIIEYIASIMKAEDMITAAGVEMLVEKAKVEELKAKAAAIEAEIYNRQIMEAYAYSMVTAEAFNASVQAEEMAAIAENVEPVTFEIERFNEGEKVMADSVATIDTAVSAVPIVDEDAEFDEETKKFAEEIQDYDADVAILEWQIVELKEKLRKLEFARDKKRQKILEVETKNYKRADVLNKWLYNEVKFGDKGIVIKSQGKKQFEIKNDVEFCEKFWVNIMTNGAIWCLFGNAEILIAEYHSVKDFKAAIRELAAAIERGDEEFTFTEKGRKKTA